MSYADKINKLTRESVNDYCPIFISASGLKKLKAGLRLVMDSLEKQVANNNLWQDDGGVFFFGLMREYKIHFIAISEKTSAVSTEHVVPLIILDLIPQEWPPKFKGSLAYAISFYFKDQMGPWDHDG